MRATRRAGAARCTGAAGRGSAACRSGTTSGAGARTAGGCWRRTGVLVAHLNLSSDAQGLFDGRAHELRVGTAPERLHRSGIAEAQGQHTIRELLRERIPADNRVRQLPQLLEPCQHVRPSAPDRVDLRTDPRGLADLRRRVRLAVLGLRGRLGLRLLRLGLGLRRLSRRLLRALLSLWCRLTRLVRRGRGILRGQLGTLGWLTLARVGLRAPGGRFALGRRLVRCLLATRLVMRSVLTARLLAWRLLGRGLRRSALLDRRLLDYRLLGSAFLCRGALCPLVQHGAGRGHRVCDSRIRVGVLGRCWLSACTRSPPAGTAGLGRGGSALLSHTLRCSGLRSRGLRCCGLRSRTLRSRRVRRSCRRSRGSRRYGTCGHATVRGHAEIGRAHV